MTAADLPALNASLNGLAALLLSLGLFFILRGQREMHRRCMLGAFGCSCVFLVFYVLHKILVASHRPIGAEGGLRTAYYVMLASHILLAMAVVPMALISIRHGLAERFDRHKRIARWTWPIWMYVSVTGVLIYFMLYHWYPPVAAPLTPAG
ncbi:MAG: DUF420 domain-containing protein [Verrucomicrobia bacterium]|nr:DUF420 domain-containing protein [Verrucomicrobiota bacterium]